MTARSQAPHAFVAIALLAATCPVSAQSTESSPTPDQSEAAPSTGTAAEAEAPPEAASPTSAPTVDVTVRGGPSAAQRLTRSAEAVNVIETRRAKQQSADLGEVLARTQGIAIRRDGGLGSNARFSLNGLYDDQIRFFLDGVPLDVAGFPFGIANVPVNLIERVEVYRGVVPIRFGADALGGALNLVSDSHDESRAAASYQVGSFGNHRATVQGRYRHQPSGFVLGAHGFADKADNDFRVTALVADPSTGQEKPARVRRFHDGYRAFGGALEAGVVDRPWAKRLLVRAYATTYDKELQHNIVMRIPYGEVESGQTVYGATARYEVALSETLDLETVVAYAHRTIDYVDKAPWTYDWYGARTPRRRPGEVSSDATDQTVWQQTGFARALLSWRLAAHQTLRASVTPTLIERTGDERIQAPGERDPLTAERRLFKFVSGLEYELSLFDGRVSNIAFGKDYVYRVRSEEALPGDVFARADQSVHRLGLGDALRIRIVAWLSLKLSYEYATRLPNPNEVFGDGVLIGPSLALRPEVSHNGNFGPHVEVRRAWLGQLTFDMNQFVRRSDRQIVLIGNETFSYQNVYAVRTLGVENALAWTSPKRWVALDGALTYQDIRNVSSVGTFGRYDGDRIPNRPWLLASWGARLRFAGLPGAEDALEPYYLGRYVHAFQRSWASDGARATSQVIDRQIAHYLGLTYVFVRDAVRTSTTFEVSNVSNAKLFDNFGVQRPGRAYYLKLTGEL